MILAHGAALRLQSPLTAFLLAESTGNTGPHRADVGSLCVCAFACTYVFVCVCSVLVSSPILNNGDSILIDLPYP